MRLLSDIAALPTPQSSMALQLYTRGCDNADVRHALGDAVHFRQPSVALQALQTATQKSPPQTTLVSSALESKNPAAALAAYNRIARAAPDLAEVTTRLLVTATGTGRAGPGTEGIMSGAAAGHAAAAYRALPEAERATFDTLLAAQPSDAHRALLFKALGARLESLAGPAHAESLAEVTQLSTDLRSFDAAEATRLGTLAQVPAHAGAPSEVGAAVQPFDMSCGPDSISIARAEADPVLALRYHHTADARSMQAEMMIANGGRLNLRPDVHVGSQLAELGRATAIVQHPPGFPATDLARLQAAPSGAEATLIAHQLGERAVADLAVVRAYAGTGAAPTAEQHAAIARLYDLLPPDQRTAMHLSSAAQLETKLQTSGYQERTQARQIIQDLPIAASENPTLVRTQISADVNLVGAYTNTGRDPTAAEAAAAQRLYDRMTPAQRTQLAITSGADFLSQMRHDDTVFSSAFTAAARTATADSTTFTSGLTGDEQQLALWAGSGTEIPPHLRAAAERVYNAIPDGTWPREAAGAPTFASFLTRLSAARTGGDDGRGLLQQTVGSAIARDTETIRARFLPTNPPTTPAPILADATAATERQFARLSTEQRRNLGVQSGAELLAKIQRNPEILSNAGFNEQRTADEVQQLVLQYAAVGLFQGHVSPALRSAVGNRLLRGEPGQYFASHRDAAVGYSSLPEETRASLERLMPANAVSAYQRSHAGVGEADARKEIAVEVFRQRRGNLPDGPSLEGVTRLLRQPLSGQYLASITPTQIAEYREFHPGVSVTQARSRLAGQLFFQDFRGILGHGQSLNTRQLAALEMIAARVPAADRPFNPDFSEMSGQQFAAFAAQSRPDQVTGRGEGTLVTLMQSLHENTGANYTVENVSTSPELFSGTGRAPAMETAMLITDSRVLETDQGSKRCFLVQDPWSGRAVWATDAQMQDGSFLRRLDPEDRRFVTTVVLPSD